MRGRRVARRAAAALCCLAFLLGLSGCGRKAMPEPRKAILPPATHPA